jgi:hypothetical protein
MGLRRMTQPADGSGSECVAPGLPATSVPTMSKALLRERHLQNYGLFKRAYQKATRTIDKDLAEMYPSEQTFRR